MNDIKVNSVSTTYKNKESVKIPKGSTIESKEVRVNVEEIENGFLICKTIDIRYTPKGATCSEYKYCTKKYFSKENPIEIETKDKALADMFDDDEYK